jgi:predicted DNA-binding transcriptional regulator YafY
MRNRPLPARGDTTERTIQIPLLLAERPHTQAELADLCRVDKVTIRRMVAVLSTHFPIIEERAGREKQYAYIGDYQYKPPSLTPAELAALLLAQQSIAATGVTLGAPFAGTSRVLLQKVRAALPAALREHLDALSAIFGSASVAAKNYAPHAEMIDRMTRAAVADRRVRMRYRTLHSGQIKDRLFDPYAVYYDPDGATLKVIGYDHERRAIIPFSVDHIESLAETDESFARPPDFTLTGFLSKYCFNGIHGEPLTVRLRAHGMTARVFAERRFHESQDEVERTTDAEDNVASITITLTVARGRGLERFILSWLPDIEVLEPAELRQQIAKVLRQASARFGE